MAHDTNFHIHLLVIQFYPWLISSCLINLVTETFRFFRSITRLSRNNIFKLSYINFFLFPHSTSFFSLSTPFSSLLSLLILFLYLFFLSTSFLSFSSFFSFLFFFSLLISLFSFLSALFFSLSIFSLFSLLFPLFSLLSSLLYILSLLSQNNLLVFIRCSLFNCTAPGYYLLP